MSTIGEFDSEPVAKKQRTDEGEKGLGLKNGTEILISSILDANNRRRSTRSVRRYADAAEAEEEVDDPEYSRLSDSDDDPDFAPSSKKERAAEFTIKGRGNLVIGRPPKQRKSLGNTNTIIRGKGSPQSNISSTSPLNQKSKQTTSPGNNNVKKEIQKDNNNKNDDTVSSTSNIQSTDVGSTSTPKLGSGSALCYPAIQRQSQAVRLPEGPQLTADQIKEIEAQFKAGDFVMAKKDMEQENPAIWRIDGKSLLQKFAAFEKDGKILYRNISTYSGWTTQGKALYVPVKTKFIFQSRYDIVVELADDNVNLSEANASGAGTAEKRDNKSNSAGHEETIVIPDSLNQHFATFEIFLQSLISQALDSNFLQEIYEENDDYFVENVKVIEDLTEDRKEKLKMMTKWSVEFQKSLEVWPCINIMANESRDTCEACHENDSAKLALFYGQPYNETTLKHKDDVKPPNKNYNVCENCARTSQTYNAICHRKFDYYSKCKTTVTNIRVAQPSKNTTTILRELLGNDTWITGLFRAMCTGFVRVDRQYEDYLENKLNEGPSTTT